eukprot:scaffold12169_cov132-Cylindrotheca_fusiformis.AAC.11
MDDEDKAKLPDGSNFACSENGEPRVRRDWDHFGREERALYFDAVETAVERGIHKRFSVYHADKLSNIYAHETCAFFLWHRRFLLAYENMLRSLQPRFACLTVPYWNVMRDYALQRADVCESYATCGDILNVLGGWSRTTEVFHRKHNGREIVGMLHDGSPIQNLRDEWNLAGIVRDELFFGAIPSSADNTWIAEIYNNTGSDQLQFWRAIQAGVHDDVHNTVGGFMRTPTSPVDPIFYPWHSMIDLFGYLWELCHIGEEEVAVERASQSCQYTHDAMDSFPSFEYPEGDMYVQDESFDVRDDPLIGEFFRDEVGLNYTNLFRVADIDPHFQYTYETSEFELRQEILAGPGRCPAGEQPFLEVDNQVEAILANFTITKVPQFSETELLTFRETWVDQAHEYWANANPNNSGITERNLKYLDCLLDLMDHDTLERWAIDDVFLEQVIRQENVGNPRCDKFKREESSEDISSSFNIGHPFLLHQTLLWGLLLAYYLCAKMR